MTGQGRMAAGMGTAVRFVLVGGAGAAANFGSRILFSLVASYELAVVFAYFVGMLTAFLGFRVFVFRDSRRSVSGQTAWFVGVNLVSLALIWLVSVGLYRIGLPAIGWTWHADTVAHAIGLGSTTITSFFAHKYLTFASAKAGPPRPAGTGGNPKSAT